MRYETGTPFNITQGQPNAAVLDSTWRLQAEACKKSVACRSFELLFGGRRAPLGDRNEWLVRDRVAALNPIEGIEWDDLHSP